MIDLDFDKGNGLLPAIAQDHATGKVLMLAYINRRPGKKHSRQVRHTTGADHGASCGIRAALPATSRRFETSMWIATVTPFSFEWNRWAVRHATPATRPAFSEKYPPTAA